MDLRLTDEQKDLVRLSRDFGEREIAPRVAEYDREERFPVDIVRKAASLGLMGGVVPTELDGAGLDHKSYALVIEEISRYCHIVAVALSLPTGLVGSAILEYGTPGQQRDYLARLRAGSASAPPV